MKIRISLLLILALSSFQLGFGQNFDDLFGKRNEVYFRFTIQSKNELSSIGRLISVDNVRNDTVWAYAGRQQFERFSAAGYKISILPHPGDVPGVRMLDQVKMLKGTKTTWNFYPTYEAYESLMQDFQEQYPSLCHLDTIGTLSSGRRLIVAKISDNVMTDEAEPEFLYSSTMHGDETTGYVLMLELIEYLLQNYGTNSEVTELVNNMEIFICPLANPDGTYHGGNSTVNGATRYNANAVDLNRNYPDPQDGQHPDGNAWQDETIAFMNFAGEHHFVAAANFHGGAEVFNYPWDTWVTRNADDDWWQFTGREYVDTVHVHSGSGYMSSIGDNGVSNGYDWYEANGGRQDYMNYFQHCREVTIELSNTKLPSASLLPNYWNYNHRSFLLYMKEAGYGFRGFVTDQVSGEPVEAKIFLTDHDFDNTEVFSSSQDGDYYRPVKAGTYTMVVSAPCYITQTISNLTPSDRTSYPLSIQLIPGAGVTTAAITSITATSAITGGDVICEGSGSITARGVCWGTASNPGISGPHTSDGSGPGSFSSTITGLSASTTYYVRAYATNTEGTVYGDNVSFNTACGTSVLPFAENFPTDELPACWAVQVSGSGASANWAVSNTSNAGGSAFEMKSTYQNVNPATTRLVLPPINTNGQPELLLSFRHMLDAYGTGATLKIQSSADGVNWTDEAWSVATTASNITASQVNTSITHNLNSGSTYIAFTVTGNLYQYDYWYIDNVELTGTVSDLPTVTTAAVTSVTGISAVSGGEVTQGGSSEVTARGVCWSTAANPGLADNHTTDGTGTGSFTSILSGLSHSTTYHVRAYATNSSGTAYGSDLLFSTSCDVISFFPWTETFENSGSIPGCWAQEEVNSSGVSWIFVSGNGSGHPSASHSGSYNACLKDNSSDDNKTLLVSPPLDISSLSDPVLDFWHTQALWSPDQDELRVYYKTSATGDWTLLATYTGNITTWTHETISLPGGTNEYYLGFEGNAKYGYGVCLDDVSVTGTTALLEVSPPDQAVSAAAGSCQYSVTSPGNWTAVCSQTWCTVTPSGSGSGILGAQFDENTTTSERVATITVSSNGAEPVEVTLTQHGVTESMLNLSVMFEGLFNGTGMNKAQSESGPQFSGTIADAITVELHEEVSPYALAAGPYTTGVNTDGTAQLSIPAPQGTGYYLVIKHRNSIETWSSIPVSFSMSPVSYDFTTDASSAYGNNLKQISGLYVIFGGDVNQDGVVDSGDMTPVDNDAANFGSGYLTTDVNGDGTVDTADMTILDNNSAMFVGRLIP